MLRADGMPRCKNINLLGACGLLVIGLQIRLNDLYLESIGDQSNLDLPAQLHQFPNGLPARPAPIDVLLPRQHQSGRNATHSRQDADQRIVVLVGPHKTGSTSIQSNLRTWIKDYKNVLPDWAWSFPKDSGIKEFPSKEYYPIVYMWGPDSSSKKVIQPENTLDLFRDQFYRDWQQQKNLVIASEGFDSIFWDPVRIEKLRDLLPVDKGETKQISFMVNYRTPRSSHLVSLFRQHRRNNTQLQPWICEEKVFHFGILNPLGLAQRLVEHGFKTILLDMTGISDSNYDVSNIVACDILGAPCHSTNKTIRGLDGVQPVLENVSKKQKKKQGGVDLSDERLERIEKILQTGDCQYIHLLKSHLVEVLYGSTLFALEKSCTMRQGFNAPEKDPIDLWAHVLSQVKKEVGCHDTTAIGDDKWFVNQRLQALKHASNHNRANR